jgi:sec-independent protein translocase protein TatB
MFDIGWSELALIAVVALIAIGPKELPSVLRTVGQWMGKARRMAAEFQGQFQEAMREAEMADLKKSFDEVKEAASGFGSGNIMTSLQKDVTNALRIDDVDKPMDPQVAADAPATSQGDTASASNVDVSAVPHGDAQATSHGDAQATSNIDAPITPTTPAAPTPETFVEAETHAAAAEPLAITPRLEPQSVQQNTEPAEPEALKDARAS